MNWMTEVQFSAGESHISFLHSVQAGSEAHPVLTQKTYSKLFPGGWNGRDLKLTTLRSAIVKNRVAMPPRPHTLPPRGTQLLKHKESFTFNSLSAWSNDVLENLLRGT
jgi:hypothetical protein